MECLRNYSNGETQYRVSKAYPATNVVFLTSFVTLRKVNRVMSFVKTAVALRPKDVEKKVRWLVGIMLVMWITSTTLEAQQFIIVPLPPTKSGFLPANRGMHTIPNRKYVSRIRSKGRGYPIPGIPGKIRKNPFVVPLKAEVKIPPERRYAAWLKIYDR